MVLNGSISAKLTSVGGLFISVIKSSILLDRSGLSFFNLFRKLIEPVTNCSGWIVNLFPIFLLLDTSRCLGFTQDGLKHVCVTISLDANSPRWPEIDEINNPPTEVNFGNIDPFSNIAS